MLWEIALAAAILGTIIEIARYFRDIKSDAWKNMTEKDLMLMNEIFGLQDPVFKLWLKLRLQKAKAKSQLPPS